jgi:hypothetical protein
MTGPRRARAATLTLAAAVLAAGCGSAAPATPQAATQPALPVATPLNASVTTSAGTWAVAEMGGSAARHDNFWQLFTRPAGHATWKLATPAGVASNGGLVIADAGGQSLIAGLRPSQDLTYTPLAVTRDSGQAWAPAGPLDAALADVPGALAAAPGNGHLLALAAGGTVRTAASGGAAWTTLATRRSLAATSAGRRCGLRTLTAVAYTPTGIPLVAGACTRPGTAGIFSHSNGTWQAAGPVPPAALARRNLTVVTITQTAPRITALLTAGAGQATSLLAAWSTDNGSHWTLSPPLSLNGATLTSTSAGPGGTAAVTLTGQRAAAITAGSAWRVLPALPPGTSTLAPGPSGSLDALAVHRATLTIWHLGPAHGPWTRTQTISIPIQYGTSS